MTLKSHFFLSAAARIFLAFKVQCFFFLDCFAEKIVREIITTEILSPVTCNYTRICFFFFYQSQLIGFFLGLGAGFSP